MVVAIVDLDIPRLVVAKVVPSLPRLVADPEAALVVGVGRGRAEAPGAAGMIAAATTVVGAGLKPRRPSRAPLVERPTGAQHADELRLAQFCLHRLEYAGVARRVIDEA